MISSRKDLFYLGGIVGISAVLLSVFLRESDQIPSDQKSPGEMGSSSLVHRGVIDGEWGGADSKVRSNLVRERAERSGDEASQQFPLVDRVLADETLGVSESATELRLIVARLDASVLEREEALAHGLNLDFTRFTDLAADADLPQPLALRLFDYMLNQNQARNTQVRVCLDLMNHKSEEIRSEATEQLAFYVGFEELAEKPEVLRSEALAFLEDWTKNPPVDPEPEVITIGIPETGPIRFIEGDLEPDG